MLDSVNFIQYIKDIWTYEEHPTKSLLVKEGALARKLFFIETGCCRCWFGSSDGKEVTMNFGFEGSFVSSMESIISDELSWYSVQTLEPTVAYSIPLNKLKELRATTREFEVIYSQYVEKRLLHHQKLFIARIRDNSEKRYRELLA